MLNLTYDEQGSNGRESYDPRPELNPRALIRHSDKAPDTLWVTEPRRCAKSARHGLSKNGTGPPPRHPDEPRDPAHRGATT